MISADSACGLDHPHRNALGSQEAYGGAGVFFLGRTVPRLSWFEARRQYKRTSTCRDAAWGWKDATVRGQVIACNAPPVWSKNSPELPNHPPAPRHKGT